jgi:hypothetical protein
MHTWLITLQFNLSKGLPSLERVLQVDFSLVGKPGNERFVPGQLVSYPGISGIFMIWVRSFHT